MRNSPQSGIENIAPEKVRALVTSLRELHDQGQPQTDQEVSVRIDDYFSFCERSSVRPGIESLCLALHISRTTLFNWANGTGCSPERQAIVQSAKAFVASFIEQALLSGQVSPPSGIFLMKNWLSYKDTVSIEESLPHQSAPPPVSSEQIAARYGLSETNLQDYSETEVFSNDNY